MSSKLTGIFIMAALFVGALYGAALAEEEKYPDAPYWGQAYEAAKKAQIEHPDAGKCMRPVNGLDGNAAQKAVESYRSGFSSEKKEITNVNWSIGNKQ